MATSTTTLSDLQEDVIYLIFEKLTDNLDDVSSCARVCISWLSIVELLFQQLFPTPFMLLTYKGYERTILDKKKFGNFYSTNLPPSQEQYRLFNTRTRKTHVIKLPQLYNTWFRSVSHGWLLTTGCENPHEINLLNPLTRARIKLPLIQWSEAYNDQCNGDDHGRFRVMMSSSPLNPSCVVLAIHPYFCNELDYCRPGDQTWSTTGYFGKCVEATIFYKHEFYIIGLDCWENEDGSNDYLYRIRFDESTDPTIERLLRLPKRQNKGWCRIYYLAELMGDLLLISRSTRQLSLHARPICLGNTYVIEENLSMRLYKLQVNGDDQRWVRLTSLRGNVIYLGSHYSVSMPAGKSYGRECQPNCIYLTDESDSEYTRDYNCVFNVETKRFTSLYLRRNAPQTTPLDWFRFQ